MIMDERPAASHRHDVEIDGSSSIPIVVDRLFLVGNFHLGPG